MQIKHTKTGRTMQLKLLPSGNLSGDVGGVSYRVRPVPTWDHDLRRHGRGAWPDRLRLPVPEPWEIDDELRLFLEQRDVAHRIEERDQLEKGRRAHCRLEHDYEAQSEYRIAQHAVEDALRRYYFDLSPYMAQLILRIQTARERTQELQAKRAEANVLWPEDLNLPCPGDEQ